MSDNHRRYCAIHEALTQLMPHAKGHVARHLLTLPALICGIVGSKHNPTARRRHQDTGQSQASEPHYHLWQEFRFTDLALRPGDHLEIEQVTFTQARYASVTAVATWKRGCKEPLYLVTNMQKRALHLKASLSMRVLPCL